jgi:hypothetical protein
LTIEKRGEGVSFSLGLEQIPHLRMKGFAMSCQKLFAVLGLALLITTISLAQAPVAPGSNNWSPGYPSKTNSGPKGVPPQLIGLSDVVPAQGWAANSATFNWQQIVNGQTQGAVQGVGCVIQAGQAGQINGQGVFGPAIVQVQPGTYQVWMTVIFKNANTGALSGVATVVFQITVT